MNIKNREKDYSISVIRMIAFCFIVTCHMMQYLDFVLAWWFNVGVQIFLCISGYLYGQRKIENVILFYKKQIQKILVPYWIVVVPIIIIQLIFFPSKISIVTIARVLICNTTLEGGAHLWFIPVIIMCYIITPFLEKYFDYCYNKNKRMFILYGSFLVVLFLIVFGTFVRYFDPAWMTCYMLGYALGFLVEKNPQIYRKLCGIIISLSVFNIVQIYLEYFVKVEFQGVIQQIYILFCNYNHVFLGICLFVLMKYYFDKMNIGNSDVFRRLGDVSDKYSYEGYLVHQFLILGPMSLMSFTNYLIINILIIIVMILIFTYISKNIALLIMKR